jgi:hypothetical protein
VFDNGYWIPTVSMASQSPLHIERHAYIDLAPKQGDEMTTKNQHRVKVIKTKQRTVELQAPQKPMSFVTRQDNDDEAVVHYKWPRETPDKLNDASRRLEPWIGTLHRGDDQIEPMYVSTCSQDRGGGADHRGNECQWTFVREQKDALDMLTSSLDPRALVVIDE